MVDVRSLGERRRSNPVFLSSMEKGRPAGENEPPMNEENG